MACTGAPRSVRHICSARAPVDLFAYRTSSLEDVIEFDRVPPAFDQRCVAVGAPGVLTFFGKHIANVHILKACFFTDVIGQR